MARSVLAWVSLALAGCSSAARPGPASTPAAAAPSEVVVAPPVPVSDPAPGAGDARSAAAEDAPGWLGVELASPPPGEAGVIVRGILRGSPAERAGLQPDDRILRIDAETMLKPPDVVRAVSLHRAGERVGLALRRGGADRLIAVVLDARPDENALLENEFLGAPAPAWRPLTTVRGSVPATLAELRGNVVVLEFWASWCVACRMSIPTLNAWRGRYGAQGLTVLGVTTDSPELATEASIELGIEYPVLSDADGQTTRVYRALALPTMFVIDREGTVRDVFVGYSSERLTRTEAKLGELIGQRRIGAR